MDYFWSGTQSGGWQEADKERAAQQQEDKRLANAANKREKARVKALEAQGEDPPGGQQVPGGQQLPPNHLTPPQGEDNNQPEDQQHQQPTQPGAPPTGGQVAAGGQGGGRDGRDNRDNNQQGGNPPVIMVHFDIEWARP